MGRIIVEGPNELYHYGRKGMKWYQNIFGERKGAPRKRRRTAVSQDTVPMSKPKTHKDMSDEELKKATERYNLEANYLSAKRKVMPKTDEKPKSNLAKDIANDLVKPAIINAGKTQLEKYLNTQISKLTATPVDHNSFEYIQAQSNRMQQLANLSTNRLRLERNAEALSELLRLRSEDPTVDELGRPVADDILERFGDTPITA